MLPEAVTVSSWDEFVAIASKASRGGPEGAVTFRGQAKEAWGLTPSLLRLLEEIGVSDVEVALDYERKAVREFQRHAHMHSRECAQHQQEDNLFWWEMMQHYGAPSRLLDCTHSPYVALYFAVTEHAAEDGVVFVADVAHLAWIQSVRRDKPGFENLDSLAHLQASANLQEYEISMGMVGCPRPTDRMVAQQSEFLYSTELLEPYDVTADQVVYGGVRGGEGHTIFKKYIIPSSLKTEMQAHLYSMNITARSLFPGLDGLGRGVRDRLRLADWWTAHL